MHHNPIPDIITGQDPVVNWLVPDLIPQGNMIQLCGGSHDGKSYLSYYMAMAVATRTPFLGFKPRKAARVLYCDVENSQPDRDGYLRGCWKGLDQPDIELIRQNFWCSHFELGNTNWEEVFSSLLKAHEPRFVIIDMASGAFNIKDENDNAEATRVIQKLRCIGNLVSPAPAMLILRHAKTFTDEYRKARGAQAWKGCTDSTWFLTKHVGRPKKNGLQKTTLAPDKVRAYGLREEIIINPELIGPTIADGIKLVRE